MVGMPKLPSRYRRLLGGMNRPGYYLEPRTNYVSVKTSQVGICTRALYVFLVGPGVIRSFRFKLTRIYSSPRMPFTPGRRFELKGGALAAGMPRFRKLAVSKQAVIKDGLPGKPY